MEFIWLDMEKKKPQMDKVETSLKCLRLKLTAHEADPNY